MRPAPSPWSAGISTVTACRDPGYVCAALSRQQIDDRFGPQAQVALGQIGVCAYAPQVRGIAPSQVRNVMVQR